MLSQELVRAPVNNVSYDFYPALPLLGNIGLALNEQIRVFNVQNLVSL